jgi:hypothetical protein
MVYLPKDSVVAVVERPTVAWEEPACLLCGSELAKPFVEAQDARAGQSGLWFAIVQCQECGLCFTSPRPDLESIQQFYDAGAQVRSAARLPEALFAEHGLGEPIGTGRLLEIVHRTDSHREQLERRSWQVTTVEAACEEDFDFQAAFDVILLWDALQRIRAPGELLARARQRLNTGGKLVAAVTNIDSLAFRWFGPSWLGLDLPRQLTHFAPWTLHLMLEKAGYRVGPVQMLRQSPWLQSSALHACQMSQGKWWQRLLTRSTPARWATAYAWITSQSDCLIVSASR